MTYRECANCNEEFEVEPGKEWARECFDCWKAKKKSEGSWRGDGRPQSGFLGGPGVGNNNFRNEFNNKLDRLLRLCHPDKHHNNEASNEITVWLLEQREKRDRK